MKNHWLDEAKYSRIFREIDEVLMEVWAEDGTFADFVNAMTDEQKTLFGEMRLVDTVVDRDENEISLTLNKP